MSYFQCRRCGAAYESGTVCSCWGRLPSGNKGDIMDPKGTDNSRAGIRVNSDKFQYCETHRTLYHKSCTACKDATIAALQARIVNTDTELDKQKELNSLLREEVERLKKALRSSMNELLKDATSPEVQDYFDYVKELREENAALKAEVERLQREFAAGCGEIERLKEKVNREGALADARLDCYTIAAEEHKKEVARLLSRVESAEAEADRLQRVIESLKEEREAALLRSEELEARLEKVRNLVDVSDPLYDSILEILEEK